MKKTKKALSLVIAISITLIMGLLALYILEYMIPFSKNTKNIENSISAYYQADSGIEDALYSMSGQTLSFEKNDILFWNKDYWINMTASWTILPPTWQWNSEFDFDYNIIRIWKPIQIEVWNDKINNVKIIFRVPDLNNDYIYNEILTWSKIINWQLSWQDDVLNSYNSQIEVVDIDWTNIKINNKNWRKWNDTTESFSSFYSSNCWSWKSCKLKMSVINKLELTDWTSVPYLEWKITNINSIPLRYRIIKTTWKSYWFRKNLNIKVPQQTVNEAFDFTVFQ